MIRYKVTVTNGENPEDVLVFTCHGGDDKKKVAEAGISRWLVEQRPRVPLSITVDEIGEDEPAL